MNKLGEQNKTALTNDQISILLEVLEHDDQIRSLDDILETFRLEQLLSMCTNNTRLCDIDRWLAAENIMGRELTSEQIFMLTKLGYNNLDIEVPELSNIIIGKLFVRPSYKHVCASFILDTPVEISGYILSSGVVEYPIETCRQDLTISELLNMVDDLQVRDIFTRAISTHCGYDFYTGGSRITHESDK